MHYLEAEYWVTALYFTLIMTLSFKVAILYVSYCAVKNYAFWLAN
jgi:hypothetical protein